MGTNFAVIDTETNWNDRVMSVGIVISNSENFLPVEKKYYIITPEVLAGGMFINEVYINSENAFVCSRENAVNDISDLLKNYGVKSIFAYNARFDKYHLPELSYMNWFDIMRIAAYSQFNSSIPDGAALCKTGRLKSGYGVEPILRLLKGDSFYREMHNALDDAVDELCIMRLLGHNLNVYSIAKV